ncbi:MAG: HPr family phosphocarrier protein [Tyzzerella sp.]|uniref:HPr family phosphocarrier protein n=1 Tax=Candidatus Fimicola merdigallinarum TaxID=2840819 RepID=A0A9D9H0L5_9FIRM|nr:HPr family phosphocarrier protein [Candidatus Fimicola merdigallinarum]
MMEKTLTIGKSLDARQAAFFVQTASKFESKVQVSIGDRKVNAKSIMGTISLGINEGEVAVITAEGIDEELAINEIAKVLE